MDYDEVNECSTIETAAMEATARSLTLLEKTDYKLKKLDQEKARLLHLKALLTKHPEVQQILDLLGQKGLY